MERIKNKLQCWIDGSSKGKRAEFWLFFLGFSDASFSPIPPDIYMIPALMGEKAREKWWKYSSIVSLSSVLGGIFGYIIGFTFFSLFGNRIIDFYNLQNEVLKISEFLSQNAFLTIFTGAFTPLPYKVFTVSAGLFKINFFIFILASVLGRSIRYFLMGFLMKVFGERITRSIFKYFKSALVIILVLLVIVLFS